MAKDGTQRGGPRQGAGRKQKALAEKIESGNPGGRKLMVLDFPEPSDLTGNEMPEPREFLKAKQKGGEEFHAVEIYESTWRWLKERGCEKLVTQQMVEQYAMSCARYIQVENAVSEFGFLAKHPTTGNAIASPYVSMSRDYKKQITADWYPIFQIVKENCSSEFSSRSPGDDLMEHLLRSRG